jgi:hypothetical protein
LRYPEAWSSLNAPEAKIETKALPLALSVKGNIRCGARSQALLCKHGDLWLSGDSVMRRTARLTGGSPHRAIRRKHALYTMLTFSVQTLCG